MVLNGFPGWLHGHTAEGFEHLSTPLAVRAGADNLADADLASRADLAERR